MRNIPFLDPCFSYSFCICIWIILSFGFPWHTLAYFDLRYIWCFEYTNVTTIIFRLLMRIAHSLGLLQWLPISNSDQDPMWSPPQGTNYISEVPFEPIYPELNQVTIETKSTPASSTSMAVLGTKRDSDTRSSMVAETIRRVHAKVMALPAGNFSHTIENLGTLEPGVSTRRVITEFADLPNIGVYCIIYDEVESIRSEEE